MNEPIQLVVHDPVGPRWTRLLLPMMGILVTISGFLGDSIGPAAFLGVALLSVSGLLLGRHRPREAELEIEESGIRVSHAGILTQSIAARDVVGASTTSRADGGVTLALSLRGRKDHPVLLAFDSARDADTARSALGIGHFGAGSLMFRSAPSLGDTLLLYARISLSLLMVAAGVSFMVGSQALPMLLFPTFVALSVLLAGLSRRQQNYLGLGADGVSVRSPGWSEQVPFHDIVDVDVEPGLLLLRGTKGIASVKTRVTSHSRIGLSPAELEHVVDQIRSASRRARGEGAAAPDMSGSTDLEPRDSSSEEWLARLEVLSKTIRTGGHYRAMGLTSAQLWDLLENPDASILLRAAAAYVLVLADPAAHARVLAISARIREPWEARVIPMFLDDPHGVASDWLDDQGCEDDDEEEEEGKRYAAH